MISLSSAQFKPMGYMDLDDIKKISAEYGVALKVY